ncbi:MAG: ATP-binding protein, partial [Deferribacteraceae bacterium]|nr:ATP-binding protein [Deferribacteraceae bacterium]
YHSSQQQIAFLKELHAIQNDYDMRVNDMTTLDGVKMRWKQDVFYRGLDIMSGDSYSMRMIDVDRSFIFTFDAMGKGVGASVTSMMSMTFMNYLVTQYGTAFNMYNVINEFLSYIKRILLKDEILCANFLHLNSRTEEMYFCSFGMPKLFMTGDDGVLRTLKCNNLPIMRYTKEFKIDILSLVGISKILVSSDGLNEASNGEYSYEQFIADDFMQSCTLSEFKDRFLSRFPEPDDDLTIIFLSANSPTPVWSESLTVKSTLDELHRLERFFNSTLARVDIDESDREKLDIAFTEAIMNAYEHGNLGLTLMDKHRAMNSGDYDEVLAERQLLNADKTIKATISLYHANGCAPTLEISVLDEGAGVPKQLEPVTDRDPYLMCGRGLEIIKQYSDHVYYSHKGNEIIIVKVVKSKEV